MFIRIIFFLFLCCHTAIVCHAKEYALGFHEATFSDPSRTPKDIPRSLKTAFWYPTESKDTPMEIKKEGTWKLEKVVLNAPMLRERQPLILISHGYSGNPYSLAWIAEHFAKKGYIVASVTHEGNSIPDMVPYISLRPWYRPEDISVVLTRILNDPKYKLIIDRNKISMIGYSQGGATALWLGGARAAFQKKIEQDINPWKNVEKEFSEDDLIKANGSFKDSRIGALIAIAPALDYHNRVFKENGLLSVDTPTYIITGVADTTVSIMENSLFFAENIPNVSLTTLPGKVTHWTFLNEGKEKKGVVTEDDPSINRKKVHEKVFGLMEQFLNNPPQGVPG